MLLEAQIGNFQSYVTPQLIRFEPTVTFLVGRNDVGKSALLRALSVFVEPQKAGRNGFRLVLRQRLEAHRLLNRLNLPPAGDANRPTVEALRNVVSATEWVTIEQEFFSATDAPSDSSENTMRLIRLALPDVGASWIISPKTNVLEDLAMAAETDQLKRSGPQLEGVLKSFPFKPRYLAPKRAAATGDAGKTNLMYAETLTTDGSNLTNVWAMATLNRREVVEEIEAFMRSAFPSVARIDAFTTPINPGSSGAWAELNVVYADGRRIPLKQCGTGIEQMLILATGVVTAPDAEVYLIDEPHGYLHADAERKLMEFIDQHPRHQYVIATHSPTLLRSKPINHGRLFRFEDGETRVSDVRGREAILVALELTPIDLWLDRGIVWVEGPTEETIFDIVKQSDDALRTLPFAIRALPNASRFVSTNARTASSAFESLKIVSEAVTPLPVTSSFLLDRDERKTAAMDELKRLASGHTFFLPFREIENAFLHGELVHAVLAERAVQIGQDAPDRSAVDAALKREISKVDDEHLYRERPVDGQPNAETVVGSEVFERLFWEFIKGKYDKVADGKRLAELAAANHCELLQPLAEVLRAASTARP